MAKRYCEMCDKWTSKAECPACGMPTRKALADTLEQRHAAASVPPYAVRKTLRENTLKVGR